MASSSSPFMSNTIHGSDLSLSKNYFTLEDCKTALAHHRFRQTPKIKSENPIFEGYDNPTLLSFSLNQLHIDNNINIINFNVNNNNNYSSPNQTVSFSGFYQQNPNWTGGAEDPKPKDVKVKKEVVGEWSRVGEEGVTRSLPGRVKGTYVCPKCRKVCDSSQLFASHVKCHYMSETPDERRRRLFAKVKRKFRKTQSHRYKIVNSVEGITVVPRA